MEVYPHFIIADVGVNEDLNMNFVYEEDLDGVQILYRPVEGGGEIIICELIHFFIIYVCMNSHNTERKI